MFYTRYKLSQNVWTRKSVIALSITMILFGSLLGAGIISAATAPQASPTTIGAPNVYGDTYYVGAVDVTDHLTSSLQETISYIIYKIGATIYAKSGATGQILTSGSNAATVIQAAIDATPAGYLVFLRAGTYDLGTTGIYFANNGKALCGESRLSTILEYSGTGNAVTINWNNGVGGANSDGELYNLEIRATGGAQASATAYGLRVNAYSRFLARNIAIQNFAAGTGLAIYGANTVTSTIWNLFDRFYIYNCKTSVDLLGYSNYAVNQNSFRDFIINGNSIAASTGVKMNQYAESNLFSTVDVSSCTTAFDIDGDKNTFINTYTETVTTHFLFGANSNNNLVMNHDFTGGGTYVSDGGTKNRVKFCDLYVTENSGTATIPNTATSIVVNHGCSYTPSALHVSLTLTNNPTNDPGIIYVDTFTSTQMTIRCRSDPGATGAIIAWAVRQTP